MPPHFIPRLFSTRRLRVDYHALVRSGAEGSALFVPVGLGQGVFSYQVAAFKALRVASMQSANL